MTVPSEVPVPPATQNLPEASKPSNPPKTSNSKVSLPESIQEWKALTGDLGCRQKTLNSLVGNKKTAESRPKIKPASDITQEQFACLRALWPHRKSKRFFPANAQCKKRAQDELGSWPEFQAYLNAVKKPDASLDPLGPWTQTKMFQSQIPS